jgi:quinone-modifying oxidoreductase subunit QmoC
LSMQGIGLKLMKAKRLNPMEILGGHKCKDTNGIHKMLAKAKEIEDRRQGLTS